MIEIRAELTEQQAWAFAQFLKRVGFVDYMNNAVDSDEAREMLEAGEELRKAFAEAGYAPR